MEEKNLTKYNGSFFKKIANWFKNLFGKKEEIRVNNDISESTNINDLQKQENDKEKFFELYNNIKEGKVDINSLSYEELKHFNMMIDEEIDLKNKKLDSLKRENEDLIEEVKKKEEELNRIKAQINA